MYTTGMKRPIYDRIRRKGARLRRLPFPQETNLSSCLHAGIMYEGGGGVALTYDRHAAQWGDERRRGKAVGSKVPQFADAHENHPAPPHRGRVVGLGAALHLTHVGIFLSGREGNESRRHHSASSDPESCARQTRT